MQLNTFITHAENAQNILLNMYTYMHICYKIVPIVNYACVIYTNTYMYMYMDKCKMVKATIFHTHVILLHMHLCKLYMLLTLGTIIL